MTVGLALLVAGGIAAGTVGGWAAANRIEVGGVEHGDREVVAVALPDYIPGTAAWMPDVRGMSETDASAVLAEAGISASVITIVTAPAAGPVGVVVRQSPVFGTLNPTSARIVVSSEARMPDVRGGQPSDAVAELQALGARVIQLREYVPGATIGTIVAVAPEVGEPLPDEVTVTIADSPVQRSLNDFGTLQGSAYRTTDVVHDGVAYGPSLQMSVGSQTVSTAWDLEQKASLIEGTLALDEDAAEDFSVVITAIGDGTELGTVSLTAGQSSAVQWDVRGVRTFTLRLTGTGDSWRETVYLLDEKVLGSYTALSGTTP